MYHPWQRRKVTIPKEENESSLSLLSSSSAAYGVSDHQFWHDLIAPLPHSIPRRPWPTSQVLSSTITASNTTTTILSSSPLLQAFYESVGKIIPGRDDNNKKKLSAETTLDKMTEQDGILEDLDNPAFSTLTPSQHRRYWKLVQQTERRTPSEKMHWKQLQALIPTEQAKYRQAVQQFWLHHKNDRLLLGFQSSSSYLHGYCQWACTEHGRYDKNRLATTTTTTTTQATYGKCRQVLSLRSMAVNEQMVLDVTTLDFTTIVAKHNTSTIDQIPLVATLPTSGTRIPHPSDMLVHVPLSQDGQALELADQHGAQMIITDQTLETLLKIPGDGTTQWILPVTRNNTHGGSVLVVDDPLEQMYTTPRECLTCGIQEGLYQHLLQTNSSNKAIDVSLPDSSLLSSSLSLSSAHVYTIWNLPSGRRSKPLRVLIRSTIRLQWPTTTTTTTQQQPQPQPQPQPLKIRVHVDFFPERGQEIVSRYERSLWILDQCLGHVGKLCRVDGRHGTILEWQDTSVAHAFATDTEDPMAGFVQVVQFLQAVATIDFGDGNITTATTTATTADPMGETSSSTSSSSSSSRLLCLPSRESTSNSTGDSIPDPYSVSVHAPTKKQQQQQQQQGDDHVVIDLQVLLHNANGVLMNAKAIGECYRPWKWDIPDRIPYTFPTNPPDPKTTTTFKTSSSNQNYNTTKTYEV